MSVTIITLAILLLYVMGASGGDGPGGKVSPSLREVVRLSADDDLHKCWLFLSEGALTNGYVEFSERALARRARVDPTGLLRDSLDLEISSALLDSIRSTGARIRHVSRWLRAVSVEANAGRIEHLALIPEVLRIELVRTLVQIPHPELLSRSFDPGKSTAAAPGYGFSELQNKFVKADRLHAGGLSGTGVIIAILDSGFKTDHPAFDSTDVISTWDFINGVADVSDVGCPAEGPRNHQDFHGTLVAGIIGGFVPDTLIGVAYGASLALAKTEITCGGVEIKREEDNWIAAAEWADSLGADIITSSLGYTVFQDGGSYSLDDLDGNTSLITKAADIAASKNILVINSAGNEGRSGSSWGTIIMPADGDSVIAVGAVYADSSLAPFSSPGPTADGRIKPDIVSLGVSVYSASHTGGFSSESGTSFSAPLVAAGAALALEHDPSMTATELRSLIHTTGDRSFSPDNDYGYGLYDAASAADIIKIDSIGTIRAILSQETLVHITSSGRTDSIPVLSALDLPRGVRFGDSGNGRGLLTLSGVSTDPPLFIIGLTASVGWFVDTTFITAITYADGDRIALAAPNPFSESVQIILSSEAGTWQSVSIFNIAGEKIWEKVNQSGLLADDVIVWDGRNSVGREVASGTYIVVVQATLRHGRLKLLKI